jgi:dTMP kinase
MSIFDNTKLKSEKWEQFPGMFLTVEGPDGSGKTTVMPRIIETLKEGGIEPVVVRQPGGSPFAEKIRQLVLGTEDTGEPVQYIAEALLFAAARSQCLESVVKPALREGKVVVADRWYDSNYAYQGEGRGMIAEVEMLEKMVEGHFRPDVTLFLKISLGAAQARLANRKKEFNRMNAEEMLFKSRTFDGYKFRRDFNTHRMVDINAEQSVDLVLAEVDEFIFNRFIPAYKARKMYMASHEALFPQQAAA